MKTPAEKIADIGASLPTLAEKGDTAQRVKMLRDTAEAIASLGTSMAVLYQAAMREFVADVGATAAARQLGLSRNRIYQIIKEDDK